jgi:hypothetical protein
MTLREAIEKASVLVIDDKIVSNFHFQEDDSFIAHRCDGLQEWYLREEGVENAFFVEDQNVWQTACGTIECCKLVNVLNVNEKIV